MSRKLHEIPDIPDYNWIRRQMVEDLSYRLQNRQRKTSLGCPLYERINVQVILTQECPYHCPFCIERQNPMNGHMNFTAQIKALEQVLMEHPNARLSITGGEPGLSCYHIPSVEGTFGYLCKYISCGGFFSPT